jgi:hypothetical protein
MRILFDNGTPRGVASGLPGHTVGHVDTTEAVLTSKRCSQHHLSSPWLHRRRAARVDAVVTVVYSGLESEV